MHAWWVMAHWDRASSSWLWAMRHEPWAMSHEPRAISREPWALSHEACTCVRASYSRHQASSIKHQASTIKLSSYRAIKQLGYQVIQAHSFPRSSLDRRSTEFIMSPKKVAGCRDGSRNVEGCWGFPQFIFQVQIINFQVSNLGLFNLRNSKLELFN